jgi:hypothetical protein
MHAIGVPEVKTEYTWAEGGEGEAVCERKREIRLNAGGKAD